jgi:hypothetical protein
MSDDLIKRLRLELIKRPQLQSEHIPVRTVFDEAADRIEELERERDEVWNAAIHKASAIANSGIEAYGAKMRAATDKKEKRDWQSMLMAAVDIQHAILTLLKRAKE